MRGWPGTTAARSGVETTMNISEIRGSVDVCVISVRTDEFQALLTRIPPIGDVNGRRRYAIGVIETETCDNCRVALICSEGQGHSEAQATTEAVIEDLDPRWIFLVGIGGAVPALEFTLGDVILGQRICDFSVTAAVQGKPPQFDMKGSHAHPEVTDLVAHLPTMSAELGTWGDSHHVGLELPCMTIPRQLSSDRFYGPKEWREKVKDSLQHHFTGSGTRQERRYWSGAIGTSNTLVKDADLVMLLHQFARSVVGFEMELGGVMRAARRKDRDYPVLAVKGISDIVGFRRDPSWTHYACESAAAFSLALLRTGKVVARPIISRRPTMGRALNHLAVSQLLDRWHEHNRERWFKNERGEDRWERGTADFFAMAATTEAETTPDHDDRG